MAVFVLSAICAYYFLYYFSTKARAELQAEYERADRRLWEENNLGSNWIHSDESHYINYYSEMVVRRSHKIDWRKHGF